jgi:Tetracyclin repressor-like, C-terminal domain
MENPDNFYVFISEYKWLDKKALRRYHDEREQMETIFHDLVREGVEEGAFGISSENVTIATKNIFGVLNWFPRWYKPKGRASAEYVIGTVIEFVFGGLQGDAGLPRGGAGQDGAPVRADGSRAVGRTRKA